VGAPLKQPQKTLSNLNNRENEWLARRATSKGLTLPTDTKGSCEEKVPAMGTSKENLVLGKRN